MPRRMMLTLTSTFSFLVQCQVPATLGAVFVPVKIFLALSIKEPARTLARYWCLCVEKEKRKEKKK